jgi:hypothetical protein
MIFYLEYAEMHACPAKSRLFAGMQNGKYLLYYFVAWFRHVKAQQNICASYVLIAYLHGKMMCF